MSEVRQVFERWKALNEPKANLARKLDNTGYLDPEVNESWLNFTAGWALRATKLFQGGN